MINKNENKEILFQANSILEILSRIDTEQLNNIDPILKISVELDNIINIYYDNVIMEKCKKYIDKIETAYNTKVNAKLFKNLDPDTGHYEDYKLIHDSGNIDVDSHSKTTDELANLYINLCTDNPMTIEYVENVNKYKENKGRYAGMVWEKFIGKI